ncbi:Putative carbohydrate metabolism domain-containing protein [Chitinophaga jiangningensis]|uniref:Putative carbohydrate metabolism domain-containing protein n=1 Tax=Chitinophaga jiangningensis TaxID=1419482 RepID=A0A1M7AV65_9BACT|nr:PCMD domain-containing protein [Chitinophaga jiangningensis]SHL46595.1 Putative carbohydrate metabolism domain-containing protein [Chitinophaga jiangningensis]
MIKRTLCFGAILATLFSSSCIKDAPLSPEADIDSFIVDQDDLTGAVFIDEANSRVQLYLTQDAYENGIVPRVVAIPGATVEPANGDTLKFDQVTGAGLTSYKITSQDGKYHKTYTVSVVNIGVWAWDFENWVVQDPSKYMYPIEPDSSVIWSSGNPGIALAGVQKDPKQYPLRDTTEPYHGQYCAVLETRGGTALSSLVGIKLFAGNFFLGVFDSRYGLSNPLASTQFGQPYRGRPKRFRGYYKYQPGPIYQDKAGKQVAGATDSCSIYAVLYGGTTRLDGTNIQTSDRIIAVAKLADASAKSVYTRFDLPFIYLKDVEQQMMLAIVMSSSYKGDQYEGAIGSRLLVDSLQIIHQ